MLAEKQSQCPGVLLFGKLAGKRRRSAQHGDGAGSGVRERQGAQGPKPVVNGLLVKGSCQRPQGAFPGPAQGRESFRFAEFKLLVLKRLGLKVWGRCVGWAIGVWAAGHGFPGGQSPETGEAINKGRRRHFEFRSAASLGFIIPGFLKIGKGVFARNPSYKQSEL